MTQATESHDDLFTKVWPDYASTQVRDYFWYARLWRVLLKRLGPPRGRLLDFGSGPGLLLLCAKRLGWVAVGEEPSDVARSHANSLTAGLDYTACSFKDASRYGPYAACISTEVLEHLDDPKAALERIWGLLEPHGKLALSVPNDNNPLQRLFGRLLAPRQKDRGGLVTCEDVRRPWIHHTHKHYFSPKTIKALVESAGFRVTWQGTSFPVELLLVLPIPRHLAWKLSRIWPAPPLLWRFGIGRHNLLVAEKVS